MIRRFIKKVTERVWVHNDLMLYAEEFEALLTEVYEEMENARRIKNHIKAHDEALFINALRDAHL